MQLTKLPCMRCVQLTRLVRRVTMYVILPGALPKHFIQYALHIICLAVDIAILNMRQNPVSLYSSSMNLTAALAQD